LKYAKGIDKALCVAHNFGMSTISEDIELTSDAIISLRRSKPWTQAELAAHTGVDQATVSRWETSSPPRGAAKKLLLRLIADAKNRGAA